MNHLHGISRTVMRCFLRLPSLHNSYMATVALEAKVVAIPGTSLEISVDGFLSNATVPDMLRRTYAAT